MSEAPEQATAAEGLAAEDIRPQVALAAGGVPTWVLVLVAVSFGSAVMLGLNAGRATDARLMATRTYQSPSIPPLPEGLAREPDYGVRVGAPAPAPSPFATAPFAPAPFATDPFAGIQEPAPAPFAQPAWPPAHARTVAGSSEAAGTYRFPTEPMPGGLGTQSTATGARIGGGSALVYDVGPNVTGGLTAGGAGPDATGALDGTSVRASLIRNRPAIVPQGEVLPATLETGVSSSRPGPIRSIISRDVRGFDGSRILIPRGSRLIGEYRADPAPGRRRVLATWTRLIRPDGVAIRIDSPAADTAGATGIPGKVDTHFLARFTNAALQSALQIGVNLASRAGDGSVIVGNTSPVTSAMGEAIVPGANEPPTVTVRPGASIAVFVARDLDFSGVPVVR